MANTPSQENWKSWHHDSSCGSNAIPSYTYANYDPTSHNIASQRERSIRLGEHPERCNNLCRKFPLDTNTSTSEEAPAMHPLPSFSSQSTSSGSIAGLRGVQNESGRLLSIRVESSGQSSSLHGDALLQNHIGLGTNETQNPSAANFHRDGVPSKLVPCWLHGCNGRTFSSLSNYRRHCREKSRSSAQNTCLWCGTQFTRKSAWQIHILERRCKITYFDANGVPFDQSLGRKAPLASRAANA